jgi:CubicO group peptidase (beta-lactamase class C family)
MDLRKDYLPREIIQLVANAPLDFSPGDRHSYSNTGYVLLGMVIERLSGKDYGTFVRERIFVPLNMTESHFNDRRAIIANRARGYSLVDYTRQNADYVSPTLPYAAGALVSSAADMAKWMQAQGSEQLLARANWEQMWTKARLNDGTTVGYGFGWNIGTNWTRKRVEHGGGIQGFSTGVTRFIDDDLSVVFMLNQDTGPGRFAWGIFGIYLPETRFNPPASIADPDPAKTEFLRQVVTALAQGTGDPTWYTPRVEQFYFPDRIKTRAAAFSMLGPLQSFDLTAIEEEPGRQKRTYRAIFGTTPMRYTLWVTPDGKVDAVDFQVE